jgi:hypothetical protein
MEFANREGPVHDALAAAIERQIFALEEAVTRARTGGRPPPDSDAELLAFELYAVLVAANQRFRFTKKPSAFAHARTAVAGLLGSPA